MNVPGKHSDKERVKIRDDPINLLTLINPETSYCVVWIELNIPGWTMDSSMRVKVSWIRHSNLYSIPRSRKTYFKRTNFFLVSKALDRLRKNVRMYGVSLGVVKYAPNNDLKVIIRYYNNDIVFAKIDHEQKVYKVLKSESKVSINLYIGYLKL